jgi:hypothetical protein
LSLSATGDGDDHLERVPYTETAKGGGGVLSHGRSLMAPVSGASFEVAHLPRLARRSTNFVVN